MAPHGPANPNAMSVGITESWWGAKNASISTSKRRLNNVGT